MPVFSSCNSWLLPSLWQVSVWCICCMLHMDETGLLSHTIHLDNNPCVNTTCICTRLVSFHTPSTWTTIPVSILHAYVRDWSPSTHQPLGQQSLCQYYMHMYETGLLSHTIHWDNNPCVNTTCICTRLVSFHTPSTWTTIPVSILHAYVRDWSPFTHHPLGQQSLCQYYMHMYETGLLPYIIHLDNNPCVNTTCICTRLVSFHTPSTWTTIPVSRPHAYERDWSPFTHHPLGQQSPCQYYMHIYETDLLPYTIHLDNNPCVSTTCICTRLVSFHTPSTWTTIPVSILHAYVRNWSPFTHHPLGQQSLCQYYMPMYETGLLLHTIHLDNNPRVSTTCICTRLVSFHTPSIWTTIPVWILHAYVRDWSPSIYHPLRQQSLCQYYMHMDETCIRSYTTYLDNNPCVNTTCICTRLVSFLTTSTWTTIPVPILHAYVRDWFPFTHHPLGQQSLCRYYIHMFETGLLSYTIHLDNNICVNTTCICTRLVSFHTPSTWTLTPVSTLHAYVRDWSPSTHHPLGQQSLCQYLHAYVRDWSPSTHHPLGQQSLCQYYMHMYETGLLPYTIHLDNNPRVNTTFICTRLVSFHTPSTWVTIPVPILHAYMDETGHLSHTIRLDNNPLVNTTCICTRLVSFRTPSTWTTIPVSILHAYVREWSPSVHHPLGQQSLCQYYMHMYESGLLPYTIHLDNNPCVNTTCICTRLVSFHTPFTWTTIPVSILHAYVRDWSPFTHHPLGQQSLCQYYMHMDETGLLSHTIHLDNNPCVNTTCICTRLVSFHTTPSTWTTIPVSILHGTYWSQFQ